MKKEFSNEEIQKMIEMSEKGYKTGFIAKELGRSYSGVYNKLLRLKHKKKKSHVMRNDVMMYMMCRFLNGYQIAENGDIYSIKEQKVLETTHLKGKLGKFVKIDDKYYNVAYLVCKTWKNAQDTDTIVALDGNPCNVDIANLIVKRNGGSPFEMFGA